MARLPEHDIQRAFFDWARMHRKQGAAYAIPNGGKRNLLTAVRPNKKVRAGVLDVCLPLPRVGCGSLHRV